MSRLSEYIKQHYIALLFFIAVSIFWAVVSWDKGPEDLTSDLHIYLGIALKEHDPSLFTRDFLLGDRGNYLDFPIFTRFLEFFYEKTGDITFGLKTLTFPLNFLFLISAYYFFFYLTNNRNISTVLSFLSSLPISIPVSAEIFGIGSATLITPRVIFTAFFPLIMISFYKAIDSDRKIYIPFLCTGLLANIHAISAFLLVQILVVTIILYRGVNLKSLLLVLKCSFLSLLGTMPYLYYYLNRVKTSDFGAPLEKVVEMFQWRIPYFYPQRILLNTVPETILHITTVALLVIPPIIIYFYKKTETAVYKKILFVLCFLTVVYMLYAYSNIYYLLFIASIFFIARGNISNKKTEFALYFGFSIFYTGVLGVIILQLAYYMFNMPPFNIIHQFRAIRFSGFLIFLLIATCINWIMLNYRNISAVKKTFIIILSALVIFMSVRHSFRSYVRIGPDSTVQDMVKTASWAQCNTPSDSLFVFDSSLFRLLSKRSITISVKDIGMFFITKRNFVESYNRAMELKENGKKLPELIKIAEKYGADYIVLEKGPPLNLGSKRPIYENSTFMVIKVEKGSTV